MWDCIDILVKFVIAIALLGNLFYCYIEFYVINYRYKKAKEFLILVIELCYQHDLYYAYDISRGTRKSAYSIYDKINMNKVFFGFKKINFSNYISKEDLQLLQS